MPTASVLSQTFLELVKIPSPSYRERAVGDYVKNFVKKLGYALTEDGAAKKLGGDCGNLIVKVPATKRGVYPALLLSAHLDTVEDGAKPIKPLVEKKGGKNLVRTNGESIVGADDKSGVAVLLELLRIIKKEKIPHGDLLFVFSVAEEKSLSGAELIDKKIYQKLDAGIVLDHSSGPDKIITAAPTRFEFHLTVHGIGGHAGSPENRINAAQVLAKTLARLPLNRLDEYTTANLGVMWAGTAVNIIPELAYAEYEIRGHRNDLLDVHLATILTTIESAVREARVIGKNNRANAAKLMVNKATVDVDIINSFTGYDLPSEALPVRWLTRAIKFCGLTPENIRVQGGSDANIYNARGLPTVVLGCGMHDPHSNREYADLSEMAACLQILSETISGEK